MNYIKVGTVSSVDVDSRTARVVFGDKGNMVSAPLKVLTSSPLITVDIKTSGEEWETAESYASADRELGRGEIYTKKPPDKIVCELEAKDHRTEMTVRGWLPYIGQTVLCILLPNGSGDGFVVGGV